MVNSLKLETSIQPAASVVPQVVLSHRNGKPPVTSQFTAVSTVIESPLALASTMRTSTAPVERVTRITSPTDRAAKGTDKAVTAATVVELAVVLIGIETGIAWPNG